MKRQTALVLLLVATAVGHRTIAGLQAKAADQPAGRFSAVPDSILGFRQEGPDIAVEQHVKDILETPDVLMRNYVSPRGIPVQLTIVYTGVTRRSLHFPEVCLTGQGWEIREQYSSPVGVAFVGKRIVIFKGNSEQAVLYWFKTGDYLTGSYFLNTVYWARDQLLLRAPRSMMVKVSTPVGYSGTEPAFSVLDDFAGALAPILVEQFK